jgi:pimeloyl-ACP methyl ester carboxylesterase
MKFFTIALQGALIVCLAGLAAAPARTQIWGPLTLDELKVETQRRADRNLPPIAGIKPDDARAAIAQLISLEREVWAAAWITNGERYMAQAKSLESASPQQAREAYYHAFHNFSTGRWPSEKLSSGKQKAYERSLDAFQAYGKLLDPPIETVRFPFEGKQVTAYLRLPKSTKPVPLVFGINGLDSRKEDVIARVDDFLKLGIGVFAIDMPGTGQSPILVDVGSERLFSAALDWLQTRPDIDAKRIVVQGRSWSGYWAALMAYTEKNRIRGAVVHGVGIDGFFSPEWQKKSFSTREYLFDIFPARASIYGVKTEEDYLAYGPKLSLATRGFLDKPAAPMLVVNGERDTQQPIADLYLLMKHGDPKDAWVNPAGGHMGRSADWSSRDVFLKVVLPWIARRLEVTQTVAAKH